MGTRHIQECLPYELHIYNPLDSQLHLALVMAMNILHLYHVSFLIREGLKKQSCNTSQKVTRGK
jgi:hypothetical protein